MRSVVIYVGESQDAYEHALDLEAEKQMAVQSRSDAEAVARSAHADRAALQEQIHVRDHQFASRTASLHYKT